MALGSLALLLVLPVGDARAAAAVETAPFPDVDPTSVHAESIRRLAELDIATGDADGRFAPTDVVTRAQAATLLARALGLPPAPDNRFEDVLATNVHAPAINALAIAGISTGVTETTFAPNRSVTRAQLASLLDRAVGLPPAAALPFTDVDPEDVHAPSIAAAAAAGLTTGVTETTFAPATLIRRDQLASMLVRTLDHLDHLEEPDGPAVDGAGGDGTDQG